MIKWSISTEVFSLIILFILTLNFRERRWEKFSQRRIFRNCLYLSMGAVVLNILCTYFIVLANRIPVWIHMLCNSGYFLLIVAVSSVIAYYLCRLLYEHIYQKDGSKRFRLLLIVLYLLYALLILYNFQSGIIFYFDEQQNYQRGPLINVGYGVMLLQLFVLLMITLRNRRSIDPSMRKVMRILPPIILVLTGYQIIYKNVLFNGCIVVAANIILLLNFQSRGIEQDILTPSGNRNSLHQELLLRVGGKQHFQIVAISLQQYRSINQRYGVKRGDALLYRISLWLEQLVPKGKSFRMGNVEFALLVPYEDKTSADRLVETILTRFREPWVLDNVSITPYPVFAEFIYTDSGREEDVEDILEILNFSLSLARTHKDHVLRFDSSIYQKMAQQGQIMRLLQSAIKENRFETWYQPIYNCHTGKLSTAEALLRMRDPQGNLISPGLFIPIAETNGFIDELTDIVMEQACSLLSDTAEDILKSVSVNLSAQQLLSEDFIRKMNVLTERYNFKPERLCLEVTERVLSENPQKMQAIMKQLMQKGFRFALDDFGTGHSNLSLVLENDFSCIKLDHSLVQEYPENERSRFIVNTMLNMFHTLDCQLIVEGVERQIQAQALIGQGVKWIQGFYYAKPMPKEELLLLLNPVPKLEETCHTSAEHEAQRDA